MLISEMITASPVAAVISNPRLPDNPIVECNAAFEALTGYERDEIIGRNCRFLRGPGTEPDLTAELRAGIREGRPVLVEIINYKKDGTPFRNAVMVAPIFDAQGELEYFLGSQVDVSKAADLEAGNTAGAARAQAARDAVALLSPRQREILVHMAAGKLNKQIAYELGLSERTVKMHRSSVIRTLGVRTSADAIRVAVEAGL
ncbi:PAS domain S-box-containing protein [Novosphingobium capsulatum]|uniref:PAS domain S-box-containing protein n=1 Tax=Novosphingobium capsulatum TaxID=13688 RepID=A0ABU1MQX6_9SPHN|nr:MULTISPECIES: PAS domain-containing protein [Novosphingobium]KPF53369.1 histidine kinase [Novosphingobium sp. AAP1]MDR6512733.1 PAS domain S-box-containing protein [Novosphingobium capsulatum]PTR06277.1 LuxR family transcriptional regulator [Novosphingobium sp. GV055]PUA94721.1 LuxR family transcriptional regulator [Novosphingobium sp. GV061]PUB13532.1 LuxR family transcriptional regulator [Novosphingobium sp. GV079]